MSLFNEETPKDIVEKTKHIALVDADTIAYAVCSVCESGDDEAGYIIDMEYALQVAEGKIQNILNLMGCETAELHFTRGKNFRYAVSADYKSNRGGSRTPEGLNELKDHLVKLYANSVIHTEIEADDYVVWAKKHNPDKYILAAVDKDVYNSVEGKHFNYYENKKYKIPMKWIEVDYAHTINWFYKQVLMGDAGDGIQGIKGCGPKTAEKIIKGCTLETQYWEEVVKAYKAKGMAEKEAIKTARLVSMHQLDKEGKLELWTQPIG